MLWKIAEAIIGRWQIVLGGLGLLITSHTLAYCTGRGDGKEIVVNDLRAKEAEAKANAWEIITVEGAKGAERAAEFEAKQEALRDAIKEAEAADRNALDELF